MVQVQKRKHTRFANIGTRPIPVVPIQQFTKVRNKSHHEMLEAPWEIIGPQRRTQPAPVTFVEGDHDGLL